MQPDLDLVYNSQNTQQGSIFGEGWSVSIPYISRLNKTGVDNLYSTSSLNYFTSALDGEIVSTSTVSSTGSSYVPRTENGTFNKYTFSSSSNVWTMIDKNGTQYAFGSASTSEQNDPNNSADVYKWMLTNATDTNGNTVSYSYFKDNGQIYPSSTIYTGNGTSTGIFEVDFQLATSTDNTTSSATGFAVKSNYRVSEIDAKVNGTWVRKYVLGYTTGDNGATALLGSIAESGENASGTVVSLPSSTFAYQKQTPGWTSSSTWNPPSPFVANGGVDDGLRIADANGDALSDIIASSTGWINNGAGWTSSSTWASPTSTVGSGGADIGVRVVDLNGDGLADVISGSGAWINNGAGWTSSSTWTPPVAFATSGVPNGTVLADVTGDGLPDILDNATGSISAGTSSLHFQVDTSGTLMNGLVSYFKLESDGTDSIGSSTMTGHGSPAFGSAYGKVNNGVYVSSASSSYLSNTSSTGIPTGNASRTIAAWVNLSSAPSAGQYPTLFGAGAEALDQSFVLCQYASNDSKKIGVCGYSDDDMAFVPVYGTWYLMIAEYNGDNHKVDLYIASSSLVDYPWTFQGNLNTSGELDLGANVAKGWYSTGDVDEAAVWNRDLTSQERTDLFNSGNGQTLVAQTTTSTPVTYLNTGHGWATSTVWTPPIPFVANGGLDNGTRIVDVNGDGLPDILSGYVDASGTAHYAAYINNGHGWTSDPTWDPPIPFTSSNGWDNGVRIVDVNGDGLPDLIQDYTDVTGVSHYAAYLNNGHGWTLSPGWVPPTIFDTDGGYDQGARVADINGTGLPGIISGYTDVSGVTHYAAWVNNNTSRADLLTNITYPQGGSSTIQYTAAAQFMNASGTVANQSPYPVYVASKITASDGLGNRTPTNYQYTGGTYYYNGPFDHQFAGFSTVTQTDGAGNVTKTYYDTSNGVSTSTGQYQDNFWKIGKPYRVDNYDNANNLFKTTVTTWDDTSLGGNAAFVYPSSTVELDYDGLSTHKDSATSFNWNTANGNQTQKIQWGQVTASSSGAFTDTGSDELITNYTYASSSTSNVIGKVSDETLLNQSSTKIQETQYFYDGLALGSIGAGNLTKQEDWKTGSTYVNTVQNTYNSFGLVTTSLDPRNNTSTYAYDMYNLYPATTTNALSQSTGYQYDYSTGKPTQTVDPNKLTFQTTYDGLGRPLTVLQPDQVTTSTLDTKTAYTYTDTANAVSVHETDYLTATTTVDTYSYYDGLNRLIQTRKSATDAGQYKVADKIYNNVGLLQKESLPYFASSSVKSAATSTAALYANYAYDALQRIATIGNAVGTTTNVYANWKITTTDPNGNTKDTYDDAYGNLIQVGEHNGTSTYTTTYAYDGLKDLLNLTDANGNVRSFVYDGLGREVSSTDLHASTSSNYGTWNYTYDDAGNLTSRVDPKNQIVNYTYDAINRALTEDYTGQSGTEVKYVYDSCTNGVGRLCSVSSTDGVALTTKSYDPLGNLASETKKINGTNYTTAYTYDRQGNVLTITNPDSSVIQYTYGSAGLVTSVQEKESGGSFSYLVSSLDYSPMDKVVTQVDANGVSTTNFYDPTRLYRLNNTVTTVTGFAGAGRHGGGFHPPGPPPSGGGPTTFSCTSTEQSYIVPTGTTQLFITAYGAQGGGSTGGLGGEVSGTISVTPGNTYYMKVGCQSGYNGGGSGGIMGLYTAFPAYPGGGMTWFSANSILTTSTVLLVAGGGGGQGGGNSVSGYAGGNAGGTTGSNGTGETVYNIDGFGGAGGSQSSGGAGGGGDSFGGGGCAGSSGGLGSGGYGGCGGANNGGAGGGGGGGYYGGGGGGGGYGTTGLGGGGGGGSTYIASAFTSSTDTAGVNSGDGSVVITALSPIPSMAFQNQYLLNSTTTLGEGSSTSLGGVTFGATLNSTASTTLQLQIEIEPTGFNFLNTPDVTSSAFVAPGTNVTTTYIGPNGSYHWQARAVDASNNSSSWQIFGTSATSTDFVLSGGASGPKAPAIFSLTQSTASGAIPINKGSSTNQSTIILGATLNSFVSPRVQLQIEVEATGTAFTNIPNVTSSPWVLPGSVATTSYTGVNRGYHWQARAIDNLNNTSTWQAFSTTTVGVATTTIFKYTGTTGSWTVPAGVSSITVTLSGGAGSGGTNGGYGGIATGTLSVSGNSTYYYAVGGQGLIGPGGGGSGTGGWPNGGNCPSNCGGGSGGGGGMSSFSVTSTFSTSTVIMVAGAGGGGGTAGQGYTAGGAGGGVTGGTGGTGPGGAGGGGGGSQTAGGAAGTGDGGGASAGSAGTGGNGGAQGTGRSGSGGGSGFFGGGGGAASNANNPGGGGGGSSFWASTLTATSSAQGASASSSLSITSGPISGAATSTDFVIAVPHVYFTFPTQGTSTPNFPNWQLNGDTVTSTDSYNLQVAWNDAAGDSQQSSTISASGTQIISGVNVPKATSSLDYTYDGTPVVMDATATLLDAGNTIATTSVVFTEQTTVAPLGCGSTQVQCISYTYDNDGNITQVTDQSATNAAKTVNYTYDSLNRLTSASSSNAVSGGNYLQTFSYDPVGNLLSGPAGTYAYGGSNNANPDAVTSITSGSSTVTFSYDKNGNLASSSLGLTYTWDYNNRLLSVASSSASSSYTYDYTGERVESVNGTSTVYDPEAGYSTDGTTPTKNIFAGRVLAGTIVGSGTSSVMDVVLNDHLGGTNVLINSSKNAVEVLDYYPYGAIRLDNTTSSYAGEIRKYIGQQYDGSTGLVYDNARYYNGTQGQFLSEDPMFLENQNQQDLSDPQSLNSYSYSDDNPITKSDPTGKCLDLCVGEIAIGTSPEWLPYAIAGAAALYGAASYETNVLLRNLPQPRFVPMPQMNINSHDAGGNMPPNTNGPKWIIGTIGVGIGAYILDKFTPAISPFLSDISDGYNIVRNDVKSLSNLNQSQNSQTQISSPRPTTSAAGRVQMQSGGGGLSGSIGLQLQLLQLQVQVLQLQLQVAQSTRATARK